MIYIIVEVSLTEYILSCESTIDLPVDYVKKLDVSVINANYELDGVTYKDDFGQSLDMKDFYKKMKEGMHPKTSMINTHEYLNYLTPILEDGKDIIHYCLSSGMSSQLQALNEAVEILREKYPQRKIYAVDSLMASAGMGLMIDKLASLKKDGYDIEKLYQYAMDNRKNVINNTSNENLEYVARGGRISKTAASIGNLLHICPLIEVNDQGHMVVTQKIRSKRKLLNHIIADMRENAIDGLSYNQKIFISHADNVDLASELKEMIEDEFKNIDGEVMLTNIGPTIGSHIGPGTIALFYWAKKRTEITQ